MGNNKEKDLEEKFKKDVSKEIANLKEFLIQQGKEIVKLKQDHKQSARETNLKGDGSTQQLGLSPELKAVLDKQQHMLDKQKENTTKLSKLCLGTLTELEKLEKQTEEGSKHDPRADEKMKRLTEENKKLIHLVTALDQQMTVLEGKIEKSSRPPSRADHNPGIGREEVLRIVRENMVGSGAQLQQADVVEIVRGHLTDIQQQNIVRDGQTESLIAEVQNIIGNNREFELLFKDISDKVREVENNDRSEMVGQELIAVKDRSEKVGLELVGVKDRSEMVGIELKAAISRIDKLEQASLKQPAPSNQIDPGRLNNLEAKVENIKKSVSETETKLEKEMRNQVLKVEENMKQKIGDARTALEHKIELVEQKAKSFSDKLEKLTQTTKSTTDGAKSVAEQALNKVNKLEQIEEIARTERKEKNTSSSEDFKRDILKLQDKTKDLDERFAKSEKILEENSKDLKGSDKKVKSDLVILTEKIKNSSEASREEKIRTDEKLSQLAKDVQDLNREEAASKIKDIHSKLRVLERSIGAVEENNKKLRLGAEGQQADIAANKAVSGKCQKGLEDLTVKVFDCLHDTEDVKDKLDKISKKVDRRPAENNDKTSEMSNKLYNELASKIEDVDGALKRDIKKTKTDLDKLSGDLRTGSAENKDKLEIVNKDLRGVTEDLAMIRRSQEDCLLTSTDAKTEIDKMSREINALASRVEETGKDSKSTKTDINNIRLEVEKTTKELKAVKTDLQVNHSNSTKDASNTTKELNNNKTEIETISVRLKGFEKEVTSIKTSVDQINKSKGSLVTGAEVNAIQAALDKSITDVKGMSKKLEESDKKTSTKLEVEIKNMDKKLEDLKEKLSQAGKEEALAKSNKVKSELSSEIAEIKALQAKMAANDKQKPQLPQLKDLDVRLCTVKEELNTVIQTSVNNCKLDLTKKISETESRNHKLKDELTSKISGTTTKIQGLEKRIDTVEKDSTKKSEGASTKVEAEVNKIRTRLDNIETTEVNKIKTRLENIETKEVNKIKGRLENIETMEVNKIKTRLENIETTEVNKINKRIDTIESGDLLKINKRIDTVESANKQAGKSVSGVELKKEVDNINKQIKDSLNGWETKLNAQDSQVKQIKLSIKEVAEKIVNFEKPTTKPEVGKKDLDELTKSLKEIEKNSEDKLKTQEKGMKEIRDKLGKVEKASSEPSKPGLGGDMSKLSSLSKAIDTIQDNSKSLETMVTKMKTEFPTHKDLEKLRAELATKENASGGLDLNHPDIGPIMDSLIMTNDRPYVDCQTVTPMTGNGLIKFERFNVVNKLPWDDANDQFIIQEPGVYAVNISAILQDAVLSVKIASNMMEREVCCVGSRDGLIGVQAPAAVNRSGLFQIEDDDNVCETVFIEIQADNEDSFIDKNVCLTLYKIAETPGTE